MNTAQLGKNVLWAALAVAAIAAAPTGAQQTTERFIPIGESPGVSNEYSYIGKIVAVDRDARTITVEHAGGVKSIRLTEQTKIWLDRSKRRRQNAVGGYEDCEVGRDVEVKYLRDDDGTADWIKIEAR